MNKNRDSILSFKISVCVIVEITQTVAFLGLFKVDNPRPQG